MLHHNQEPETHSVSPIWKSETQVLRPAGTAPQDAHFQEVKSKGLETRHSNMGWECPSNTIAAVPNVHPHNIMAKCLGAGILAIACLLPLG